jgi:hypothetical protein
MSAWRRAVVALLTAGAALANAAAPADAGEVAVEVRAATSTSAGVFDARGNLVRTLWRAKPHAGGSMRVDWDGRDEDGVHVSAASGPYSVRVLAHDVRYVWEGVIGNTSRASTGPSVHRAFQPIHDLAIDAAGDAFYVVGYNEQQNAIHRFSVTDPQVRTPLARDDYRREFRYVATDGALAYFANTGVLAPRGAFTREPQTFVIALRVGDGREHVFAEGQPVFDGEPARNRWESVIDLDDDDVDDGTAFRSASRGLAVQTRGDVLFVSHPGRNEIRLLDKRTGARLGAWRIEAATDLAIAPDDSLWVLERGQRVVRYRNERGQPIEIAEARGPLVAPKAIGVSPRDGTLVVADAGSEQLKAFDASGAPSWTLGVAGGYRSGAPAVQPNRFWFSAGPNYVAFEADGSFWVGDPGNDRNLRFDAERRYSDEIMYLRASYTAAVDSADPSRVFDRFLEFEVDYAKPLADSWALVRNWGAGLPASYFGFSEGLRMLATVAGGRKLGVVTNFDRRAMEVVELAAEGLRATGVLLEPDVGLYPNGAQRRHTIRGGRVTVLERPFAGFDRDGKPTWGAWKAIASARAVDDVDPHYHAVPTVPAANAATYPETANGVLVFFNPGRSRGFHLGGVPRGGDAWRWRTSPVGTWNVDADGNVVAADGAFELRDEVHYPASIATAAGADIVYGYHGEGWRQGQANQWLHYQDDGLFIGQFGTPTYAWRNRVEARAGSAGNAFAPALVSVGGKLYLWHNDESVHAGVHRWRIDGIETVERVSVPVALVP